MQHISQYLKKYTEQVVCKISEFRDGWRVCSLAVGTVEVKGYGTTNSLALEDAFRLLKLKQ